MMNRKEVRRISNCLRDKSDEELSFFRDLQKREKDRVASLLDQPVSGEFSEPNGNYGLYKMDSGGRKGTTGLDFLGDTGKNDYNWLKTPPATPLFPSLEMETHGQHLVSQRELPIINPLSRFAGNQEGSSKTATNKSTIFPNLKQKLPQRHKTPTGSRPSVSSSSLIDKKNMKSAPLTNNHTRTTTIGLADKTKKPALTPILKSNLEPPNSIAKPKTRGVSRPKTIPGFSDETPSNLRTTIRPASATRGRPTNQILQAPQKQDTNNNTKITTMVRRQSCSPSVARGRIKVETDGNRARVLGSRMVDRFMNARVSSCDGHEDHRQAYNKMKLNGYNSMNESGSRISSDHHEARLGKIKLNGSLNETSGFGRLMSNNSLDMAIKHMVIN